MLKVLSFLLICKCGNYFCSKHLLPEIHNCEKLQDFKKLAYERNAEKLFKNALIKQSQLDKID